MATSWTTAEERSITEAMTTGLNRVEAIRYLRTRWLIGETPIAGADPSARLLGARETYAASHG